MHSALPVNDDLDVVVSKRSTGVAVVELNRVRKRNALSQKLIDELKETLRELDRDAQIRAIVLTSSSQSPFCAGADIQELAKISTAEAHRTGWLKDVEDAFAAMRKPIVAAVRGYAFGGGFEVALMCDMIYASADARFGFPEIKLGTIPGAGGTQRLTRAIGKQKAMGLILTGASATAQEMEQGGVVTKIVAADQDVVEEAVGIATTIAGFSAPVVGSAKQAIRAAETTTLGAGLELERSLYYSSFSLEDCKEGMAAFLEKRPPTFVHE